MIEAWADLPAHIKAAIKALVQSTEGTLALLARIHSGVLPAADARAAAAIGNATPNTNVRGLFETFIPESQRRARLGPQIDPGVPWTVTLGERPLALALKSGNFGSRDFFMKALGQLDARSER